MNSSSTGQMLKLLLVSPKPPPYGGIGHWTLLLTDCLQENKGLRCRHVDTAPRWRAIDDMSILKRLAGGVPQGMGDVWRIILQLFMLRPHVLHLTTSGSLAGLRDVLVLSLGRIFRVRSVYHIRFGRMPELAKRGGMEWQLLFAAMRLADVVMVIDRTTEMTLRKLLPPDKVVFVPNAVDLTRIPANSNACRTRINRLVFYLGWIISTKGMSELMEAWRHLSPKGWEMLVAGPGNEEYKRELAGIAGGAARMRFMGEISHDEAMWMMREADIFVLPSYTEGFPNVIIEAMAAGTAIVSTRVGDIPYMLDADTGLPCGVVVEPRNAGELAKALKRVMDDASLRKELGRRARKKVEDSFSTDIVFRRYVEIWQNVAEGL